MEPDLRFGWTGTVGEVILGATRSEGGTRSRSYRIGGGTTLPFMEKEVASPSPLIAFEICDDPQYWSPIVNDFCRGAYLRSRCMGKDRGNNLWGRSGQALPYEHQTAGFFRNFRTGKNGRDHSCIDYPATCHRREQRTEDRQRGIPEMRRDRAE